MRASAGPNSGLSWKRTRILQARMEYNQVSVVLPIVITDETDGEYRRSDDAREIRCWT